MRRKTAACALHVGCRVRTMKIARAIVPLAVAVALSGCAHNCPRHEPAESSWAEGVACYHHLDLEQQTPTDRLGCYRVALGQTYLPNWSTGAPFISFIPNPEFIELTAEWYAKGRIHSGFLVRVPAGWNYWGGNGVWRPTRTGGALIDLGTGFSGLLFLMHRDSWGYSGNASTYQDVGYDSATAKADLWPVSCAKMSSTRR